MKLADRLIGAGQPCFVIAEAGVNHNGDVKLARRLVDAAAAAAADAVKFQTFHAEGVASSEAAMAAYQQTACGSGSQLDMLRILELSAAAHAELQDRARSQGLLFLSTPFDDPAVELLERLNVPAYKVGSGELTNLPFLQRIARLGKPMIVSTGMAILEEVGAAVAAIRSVGNDQIVLLHCVSNYPAAPEDANLRAMATMTREFGVPVGFSDHTLGSEVALAAVALGAVIIEKHLTLDRSLPGPDHTASMEPQDFAAFVRAIRIVEGALGSGQKRPVAAEHDVRQVARRSLYLRGDVEAGKVIDADVLVALRPAGGIGPEHWQRVVGRCVRRRLLAGTRLAWGDLE